MLRQLVLVPHTLEAGVMRAVDRVAASFLVGGSVWLTACLGGRPVLEQTSPTIPGTKFKTIATIAGDAAGPSLGMSAKIREELTNAGWNATRRAGRWESEVSAIADICADGTFDGVLVVTYDRLELTDCASLRPAYRIEASYERGVGLTDMTKRLMQYLRGGRPGGRPS
jgi:hypothetical protein